MKPLKLFSTLTLIVVSQTLFAQTDQATIVLFRENFYMGKSFSYPIQVNGQNIVKIKNGTYYFYNVAPGTYEISAKTEIESHVSVSLNAGDSCFVRCSVLPGFWIGRPELIVVEKSYGANRLKDPIMVNISDVIYKDYRSNLVFGVLIGGGGGFEKFDAFTTTGGDNVTLSTGGGFLIGGLCTFPINKNFEVSMDLSYSMSTLSQNLKNAYGDFTRGVSKVTFWGVLPLKGDYLKLRLGGGFGGYFAGKMVLDGTDLDGHKYEFKYKPAVGFNGSTEVLYVFDKYNVSFGLLFNSVHYKIKSLTMNGATIPVSTISDDKLTKPNGGGFFISMGVGFYL